MSYTMTEQGPNIRTRDMRSRRMGGDTPYRDDPNAPVHLESYTRGGYGPSMTTNALDDERKGRAISRVNGGLLVSSGASCIHLCCSNQALTAEEGPDGIYYRDDFNDMAWSCSLGTSEDHGIWLNHADPAGTIMAVMVWFLLGYSTFTITFLGQTGGVPASCSYLYSLLCALALACHVKTTLTDPGSVPTSAVPTEEQRKSEKLSMCSQCQTFKPPMSHHCRICNRCISKMDHHCPWMNNCVGAGNMKHFFLFLIYTWLCSAFSLTLLGWNYFFCAGDDCHFTSVLTQLARVMTVLSFGAFLFTSSMIMNVTYGIMTGIGTIDRLKKKATDSVADSDEEPVPLTDIFGVAPLWTWPFPIDPLFDDYDRVLGFSTPQRLLREQIVREQRDGADAMSLNGTPTGMMMTPV